MNVNWLNDLGDRNPQLLRELRGRFQSRSIFATIGIVVIGQLLLLAFFAAMLPSEGNDYSSYCIFSPKSPKCVLNWPRWWGDLCRVLTQVMPYALYVPGAYALVNDIAQETQKGTLNFLRLSPRSSQNILLGKLLGVPILGYFSFLLLLPLHLISGLLGRVPIGTSISLYLTTLIWALLLFTASMFAGFSGGAQTRTLGISGASGIGAVALIAFAGVPAIGLVNVLFLGRSGLQETGAANMMVIRWFDLLINQNWLLSHLFVFGNIALLTYWLWRVLQRTFRKPTATVLSKRQGYAIVTYVLLLVLGFMVPGQMAVPWDDSVPVGFMQLSIVASIALYGSLPLIFTLSTPRQTVLDWFRGRQEIAIAQRAENMSPGKRRSEQIRDRVFGDKSPGVTAILICALIAYTLISLLLPTTGKAFGAAVLGLALSVTLVANYAVLVQLVLLGEMAKPYVWATGSVIFAIVLPGFCMAIPGLNLLAGYFTPGLWFLLYAPFSGSGLNVALPLAFVAWGVMLVLLLVQGLILRDRLRRLARSL
jgi:ABC-type transport system involved in multi-copper enzyme maturation permease subunit